MNQGGNSIEPRIVLKIILLRSGNLPENLPQVSNIQEYKTFVSMSIFNIISHISHHYQSLIRLITHHHSPEPRLYYMVPALLPSWISGTSYFGLEDSRKDFGGKFGNIFGNQLNSHPILSPIGHKMVMILMIRPTGRKMVI